MFVLVHTNIFLLLILRRGDEFPVRREGGGKGGKGDTLVSFGIGGYVKLYHYMSQRFSLIKRRDYLH